MRLSAAITITRTTVLLSVLTSCGTHEVKRKPEVAPSTMPALPQVSPLDAAAGPGDAAAGPGDAAAGPGDADAPVPNRSPAPKPPLFDPQRTTSLGGPSGGRLRGGVALPDTAPGFRMNPKRPNPDGNFAVAELANALLGAVTEVASRFPGSELVVGDLSLENGGPIYHHGSHQSGRDVDVLFFYRTKDGNIFQSKGIPIEPDGTGDDFGDLSDPKDDVPVRLDLPRTWAFVEAFVGQPGVRTARIFVVEHVRKMLLDYAQSNGGDKVAIKEFARTTCQPAVPHDDHFHIRLFCSVQDIQAGCEDAHPIYPWQRAYLAEHDAEPSIAIRTRKQQKDTKTRTVSQKQAATKAGPLHDDVRAFLQRRKTWSKTPHPGRPFCR